jgi:hypothetical protein
MSAILPVMCLLRPHDIFTGGRRDGKSTAEAQTVSPGRAGVG